MKGIMPRFLIINLLIFLSFLKIYSIEIYNGYIDTIPYEVHIYDEIDQDTIINTLIKYFKDKMELNEFNLEVKIEDQVLDKTGKLNSIMSNLNK